MFVSELIDRAYKILDDEDRINWPVEEILSHANLVVGDLTRQLVETDKGYVDCELFIMESDWEETVELLLDFQLPPWVTNVVQVWLLTLNTDSNNPFLSTIKPRRSTQIYVSGQYWDPGYLFTQRNVLQLNRMFPGRPVSALVAKMPARLVKARLVSDALSETEVYLPQDLDKTAGSVDLGNVHGEPDWYRNEQFLVSDTDQVGTTHPVRGVTRRCVASTPNVINDGILQTQLKFNKPWPVPLRAGDVVELQVVVPDQHSDLVIYEIAGRAFIKKQSKDGLASIAGERALARDSYRRFIQPRSMREPDFYAKSAGARQRTDWQGRDPDLDHYL